MAFLKAKSNIKTSILGFLKHMVSKTQLKAVDVIFSPCCSVSIDSVDVDCISTGVYDVTVTLTNSLGYLGKGFALLSFDGVFYEGVVTEPKTITFENIAVTAGTITIGGYVFLPTNSDETSGVWQSVTETDVVFAAC